LSRGGIWPHHTESLACSLVRCVVDLLLSSQAPVSDLKLWLVERFRLVEIVPVRRAVHVSVEVLLCLPFGTIPKLTVTFVATSH